MRSRLNYNVEWEVQDFLTKNFYFQSYGLGGLDELAKNGIIQLEQRLSWQAPFIPDDDQVLIFRVRRPGQTRWVIVALDFRDQNYMFDMQSLNACNLYFKVNYNTDCLQISPSALRDKVRPAGLYFGIKPYASNSRLRNGLTKLWLRALEPQPTAGKKYFSPNALRWHLIWVNRVIRELRQQYNDRLFTYEYEQHRTTPPNPGQVFLRGRCWRPDQGPDAERIVQLRAEMLRACKSLDQVTLVGGFRDDDYAKTRFPDLVDAPEPPHREYVELVGHSEIVLNTRGLHDSFAWKLPEYMASSRCILSERQVNEMPAPLRDREEVLYFENVNDFSDKLMELTTSPELRKHLAEGTQRYYDKWVKPSANMYRLLTEATDK